MFTASGRELRRAMATDPLWSTVMNTKSLPGIIIKMSAWHCTARGLNIAVFFEGGRKKKAIMLPRCLQIAHKVVVIHVFHITEAHCPAKRVNTFISNCKGANKITRS